MPKVPGQVRDYFCLKNEGRDLGFGNNALYFNSFQSVTKQALRYGVAKEKETKRKLELL